MNILNRKMIQAELESEGFQRLTDYKRMVSYMYQYENGLKRRNVGFAKVEAKGGQCKFTLHMQLLGQLDSIFPTYLIQRGKAGTELIYLGDAYLKNQVMDSRLSADEDNIMGSGFKLTDMSGILLFFNDKIFYATVWDDSPVIKDEILEALRPKKDRQDSKSEKLSSKTMETVRPKEQVISQPVEISSQDRSMKEPTVKEAKLPNYMLPGGYKMVERRLWPAMEEAKPADNSEIIEHTEMKEIADTVDMPETIETAETVNISETIETVETSEAIDMADTREEVETTSSTDTSGGSGGGFSEKLDKETEERLYKIIEELNLLDIPQEAQLNASQVGSVFQIDPPVAKHFFDHYPRIYPFEDNEIVHCVKIEPKDIGLLPQELWPFGNNSFLMHGYYCYHHLIFAKLKTNDGYVYILGIPGIYHGREQFMAKMFGFENFKSIKKHELKQGDFGYWYLSIAL